MLHHFDVLMDHLNSREDPLVEIFRSMLADYVEEAEGNARLIDEKGPF